MKSFFDKSKIKSYKYVTTYCDKNTLIEYLNNSECSHATMSLFEFISIDFEIYNPNLTIEIHDSGQKIKEWAFKYDITINCLFLDDYCKLFLPNNFHFNEIGTSFYIPFLKSNIPREVNYSNFNDGFKKVEYENIKLIKTYTKINNYYCLRKEDLNDDKINEFPKLKLCFYYENEKIPKNVEELALNSFDSKTILDISENKKLKKIIIRQSYIKLLIVSDIERTIQIAYYGSDELKNITLKIGENII